jgi:hypothetical protein
MNFDFMDQALSQQILDDVISQGIMTLGELTATLAAIYPETPVFINDTNTSASHFESYRGYFGHLAIQPTHWTKSVGQLLYQARAALTETFTDYSGDTYEATKRTPVWIDYYSVTSGQGLVEVEKHPETVILRTRHIN